MMFTPIIFRILTDQIRTQSSNFIQFQFHPISSIFIHFSIFLTASNDPQMIFPRPRTPKKSFGPLAWHGTWLGPGRCQSSKIGSMFYTQYMYNIYIILYHIITCEMIMYIYIRLYDILLWFCICICVCNIWLVESFAFASFVLAA